MKRLIYHPLFWITLLGFILRLWFTLSSNHIFYPDEIYSIVEQSHRLVFGYGIIPWEFVYGLRSFVGPLLLSFPLLILKLSHVDTPYLVSLFPKLFLVLCSLSLIPAVYLMVKRQTNHQPAAYLAAMVCAVWYELIYFSPRAYSELIALYLFADALIAYYSQKWSGGVFLATVAGLLRIQYFPLTLVYYFMVWRQHQSKRLIAGTIAGFSLFIIIDGWFYHGFLTSIFTNIHLNLDVNISGYFGASLWWYYLKNYLFTSGCLMLVLIPGLFLPKTRNVSAAAFMIIFCHSLIPHKEYRFLLVLIPLYIVVGFCLFKKTYHYLVLSLLAMLISMMGFFNRLPQMNDIYAQPLLSHDAVLDAFTWFVNQPSVCGIYNRSRGLYHEPAYINIHRPIPLYIESNPPDSMSYVNVYMSDDRQAQISGFKLVKEFSDLTDVFVYEREGTCSPDPQFTFLRPEPGVQFLLHAAHIPPIMNRNLTSAFPPSRP